MKLRYMVVTVLAVFASAAEVFADVPALPRPQELPEKRPSYVVPVIIILVCAAIIYLVIKRNRK